MSWNKQNNILSKQTFQTVSMHRLSLGNMTKQIKAMAGKLLCDSKLPMEWWKNISFFTWVYFPFLLDTESIYKWMPISLVEKYSLQELPSSWDFGSHYFYMWVMNKDAWGISSLSSTWYKYELSKLWVVFYLLSCPFLWLECPTFPSLFSQPSLTRPKSKKLMYD